MVSNFPHLILEDIIKNNWTLPEVTTDKIDWGYYPEAQGQGDTYTIKCEDMSDLDRKDFGIPVSHELAFNSIGVVIGVRDLTSDRTRPPPNYIKMVNHVKQIVKANRFSNAEIQEFRIGQGSREIENRMTNNSRWFTYYLVVEAYYWD